MTNIPLTYFSYSIDVILVQLLFSFKFCVNLLVNKNYENDYKYLVDLHFLLQN